MSGHPPEAVQSVQGQLSVGAYGVGSKSEREAVFIQIKDHRYLLRRKNGPVFADAGLLALSGKWVECDGFIVGNTLLADRVEEVTPSGYLSPPPDAA